MNELAKSYYLAEVEFQMEVYRSGSVAARSERPDLARRVIETFSDAVGSEIKGSELVDLYDKARITASLPTDQTNEINV